MRRNPVLISKLPPIVMRKNSLEPDFRSERKNSPPRISESKKDINKSFDVAKNHQKYKNASPKKPHRPNGRPDIKANARKLLGLLNKSNNAIQYTSSNSRPVKQKGNQSVLIEKSYDDNKKKPIKTKDTMSTSLIYNNEHMNKSMYSMTKSRTNVTRLEDFTLIKTIGVGCYAKVKLAKWISYSNKPCAIKVVNKKLALKLKQGLNLIREQKLLCLLNYPYIVKWYFLIGSIFNSYTTFQDANNLYFVQEYLAGGEIYNIIRKELKSQLSCIVFYMAEIGMALEYLHKNQIVFRDLKPENVLIDQHGHARIADFGFAKKIENNRTLTMCGTPGYLSPEQLIKKEYGVEVDIWAYGIFMFELIAGYNPFYDNDPRILYENIQKGVIEWPPFITKEAKAFLKKVLQVDPNNRLQAKYFKTDLLFKVFFLISIKYQGYKLGKNSVKERDTTICAKIGK